MSANDTITSRECPRPVIGEREDTITADDNRLRMRVAFVSETWHPEINGVTHTLGHLAHHLHDRGARLQLIRPRPPQPHRDELMSEELHTGAIPIPDYDGVRMGIPAPLRLARLWREQRPDVIYIATEGPLGTTALLQARRLGIPVVSGFHTNFDQYSQYYILLKILRPLVRPFLRLFHNATTTTLVPTSAQAEALTDYGYRHVRVLGRGLDSRRFSPAHRSRTLRAEWGASDDTPVALHVGRLAAEKNVMLLIDSLEAMRRRHPGMVAVIVGDGPQRAALEKRLPWVHFAGFQRDTALAAHYASADIFLFPSLSETYGNVVIEAMASGLAVVAFDCAAAGELIEDNHQGRLAPPEDNGAFVDAAVALCDDRAATQAMGEAASERVKALEWPAIGKTFTNYLLETQEVSGGR